MDSHMWSVHVIKDIKVSWETATDRCIVWIFEQHKIGPSWTSTNRKVFHDLSCLRSNIYILTFFVSSCSSQTCQASRQGFVALAMSSWALSNSPKRFAAPGGCQKLFPLQPENSLISSFPLFFLQHLLSLVILSLQSIQSILLSSAVIFLTNWVKGCWTVCACAERPAGHVDVEMSKCRDTEYWIRVMSRMCVEYMCRVHVGGRSRLTFLQIFLCFSKPEKKKGAS